LLNYCVFFLFLGWKKVLQNIYLVFKIQNEENFGEIIKDFPIESEDFRANGSEKRELA